MNETILNGLLNLFAIFASLAKIGREQARQAVNFYLTSHFGVRSHKEYMALFEEAQGVYDDPLIPINRENVIINVCNQLKPKLVAEDQALLLLRFMEFAHSNDQGLDKNLSIFQKIADIFNINDECFPVLLEDIAKKMQESEPLETAQALIILQGEELQMLLRKQLIHHGNVANILVLLYSDVMSD